jgi:uncharacterized protein (UPF0276 family)
MAQSRPQLVQTLVGSGELLIDGHAVPVKYTVWIFQETLNVDGRSVPGLMSATGKFSDLKAADAVRAVGRSSQLILEDRKKSDVVLTDADGAFLVSGPIG